MKNPKVTKNSKTHYWRIVAIISFVAMLSIIIAGCAVVVRRPHTVDGVVYIQKAPPEPRVEVKLIPQPAPSAVWMPGYWKWGRHRYVWSKGYWEKNPRGVDWIPGHWEKHPMGWFWVPGHWR